MPVVSSQWLRDDPVTDIVTPTAVHEHDCASTVLIFSTTDDAFVTRLAYRRCRVGLLLDDLLVELEQVAS